MSHFSKIVAVAANASWLVVALAAMSFVACSQSAVDSTEVKSTTALTASVDMCGDACGNAVLAAGQACCTSGPEAPYNTSTQCCTSQGVQTKYPINDLNACPNRINDPAHPPSFNGCSTQATAIGLITIQPWLIPLVGYYSNVFNAACNVHDTCYDNCSGAKDDCDDALLANSLLVCKQRFSPGQDRAFCIAAAHKFYEAVNRFGQTFWEEAQREVCDCCSGDTSCRCASGTVVCGGTCVSTSCSGGEVFDSTACSCKCPSGTVGCGGQCVAVCGTGQPPDPATCSCGCPPGAIACGELLAPSDSPGYSFQIYSVPSTASSATVTAVVTWAPDWYPPPPNETTQSGPNLVEMPFNGGTGCDHVWKHPEDNFVNFDIDPFDQSASKVGSIVVGPGKGVAIAGSDCFFGDNFHGNHLVEWSVVLN